MKDAGGLPLLTISVLQLEMHPFEPGAAVPGALVSAHDGVQKSEVVPHCPQMLQQELSGHGLREANSVFPDGGSVPGTCGPQTVFTTAAGIGGFPVMRQIFWPIYRRRQPIHPQVCLLRVSISAGAR